MAGFLSSEPRPVAPHSHDLAVLGDPETFVPQPGDAFLLAIGIPGVRRKVAESLEARGATLLTLVHPTAVVASTASIGGGSILCPFSIVSDSARIGRCTLMNYHSSLGHDAATGDFVVLSPYATLGGGAHVDDDVFLGLHASVGPSKRIGPRSKVSANSVALSDAPADSLVYGVPGRVQPFVSGAAC
jgi:sugar O-acyltransferase (sialic acid O-acetyltransferase NeuD family)